MDPIRRNEILEMLAAGKITATEAISLLDSQPGKPAEPEPVEAPVADLKKAEADLSDEAPIAVEEIKASKPDISDSFKITREEIFTSADKEQRPRWLKIRVRDLSSDRNKVSVSIPLGFISFGLGIARRFGADLDDSGNIDEMWQMIKTGERGVLVDVQDEEDNEHVQIYLD